MVEDERGEVVEVLADLAYRAASAAGSQGGRVLPRILRGFVRDVWSKVPPVRSIVRVLIRSSWRRYSGSSSGPGRLWVRPSQPRRMPTTS